MVADLHMHTYFSDGTWTPVDMAARAVEMKLAAIAVTDHDTMRGVVPVRDAARGTPLRVIAGVEISTWAEPTDLHILGYGADPDDPPLLAALEGFRDARRVRAEEMVRKLRGLGLDIHMDEVDAIAGEGAIGRPHIASVLANRGLVGSFGEAFNRFLGYDRPAYVPKYCLPSPEGIELLRRAGAVPVMAHPASTRRDDLIPSLVEAGLLGLEVVHSRHSPDTTLHYRRVADAHRLIATGGSDSHGRRDYPEPLLGRFTIPMEVVDQLDRASSRLRASSGAAPPG